MRLTGLLYLLAATVIGANSAGPPQITTSQYDNSRSGANVSETILSPRNVNVRQFGRIWSLPVDGDVYAHPLYLPNVNVPGKGVHNVLFVATEHDGVYAFDADQNSPTPLWRASLLPSGKLAAPVSDSDVHCPSISPEIGITSTPVIDIETGTLYALARAKIWTSRSSVSSAVTEASANAA
jgi:PQQ-like domain